MRRILHWRHEPDGLTNRELEVVALRARFLSAQEIAETLFVSRRTVEFHLRNARRKIRAREGIAY